MPPRFLSVAFTRSLSSYHTVTVLAGSAKKPSNKAVMNKHQATQGSSVSSVQHVQLARCAHVQRSPCAAAAMHVRSQTASHSVQHHTIYTMQCTQTHACFHQQQHQPATSSPADASPSASPSVRKLMVSSKLGVRGLKVWSAST